MTASKEANNGCKKRPTILSQRREFTHDCRGRFFTLLRGAAFCGAALLFASQDAHGLSLFDFDAVSTTRRRSSQSSCLPNFSFRTALSCSSPRQYFRLPATGVDSLEESHHDRSNQSASISSTATVVDNNMNAFLDVMTSSCQKDTLQSFVLLFGNSKDKKTSNSNNKKEKMSMVEADQLRGRLRRVMGRRIALVPKKRKRKRGSKANNKNDDPEPHQEEQVTIMMLQVTFKFHFATDIVKNYPIDDPSTSRMLEALLCHGRMMSSAPIQSQQQQDDDALSEWGLVQTEDAPPGSIYGIQKAVLETTDLEKCQITMKPNNNNKNKTHSSTFTRTRLDGSKRKSSNNATTASLAHDRVKQVPFLTQKNNHALGSITDDVVDHHHNNNKNKPDFLQALGVVNERGQPRPGMAGKLRQIQKFVEIVDRLVTTALATSSSSSSSSSQGYSGISIVDMGCGRGYLTFALHAYLQRKYQCEQRSVTSRGIDVRPKLIQEVNDIAKSLGSDFEGLSFVQGTIEDGLPKPLLDGHEVQRNFFGEILTPMPSPSPQGANGKELGASPSSNLKVLIALHACDTATDDAIWSGIASQANVIVVAPCCHRQVRPQLDRYYQEKKRQQQAHQIPLLEVWRHPIYRERTAETITDVMRAILLEMAGYRPVQVFEFVGGEHTAKNVLVTAVKSHQQDSTNNIAGSQNEEDDASMARLQALAQLHGISEQKLASWMDKSLVLGNLSFSDTPALKSPPPRLSARQMPPL